MRGERVVYKFTRPDLRTYGDYQYVRGQWHTFPGTGELCGPGWSHAYLSPETAELHNPIHGNYAANALLWCAKGVVGVRDGEMKVGCSQIRLLHPVTTSGPLHSTNSQPNSQTHLPPTPPKHTIWHRSPAAPASGSTAGEASAAAATWAAAAVTTWAAAWAARAAAAAAWVEVAEAAVAEAWVAAAEAASLASGAETNLPLVDYARQALQP